METQVTRYWSIGELRAMPFIEQVEVGRSLGVLVNYQDSGIAILRRIVQAQRAHFGRTFEVEMRAFQAGVIREVRVPASELTGEPMHDLERVFYWGQNDFEPVPRRCSVSCGDVVRYDGKRWEVMPCGFKQIEPLWLAPR